MPPEPTHLEALRLTQSRPRRQAGAKLRSKLLDGGMLWAAWLRAPRHVGALVPSGDRLAAAMARAVAPGAGLVVEVGGGTGSITAALLRAGIPPHALIVVERDPALARRLRLRFPDCRVVCGDACRLPALLAGHGIVGAVDTVVSSLPLLSMPPVSRARVLRGVRRVLGDHGILVQYTYGMGCPVPARTLVRDQVAARRLDRIWRNVPPASIWRFEPAPQRTGRPSPAVEVAVRR